MRISAYRLAMLRVPLREPFRTSLRQVYEVADVVLLLESDCGRVGYGSAPATMAITGQDHRSIIAALQSELLPWILGQSFDGLGSLLALLEQRVTDNVNANSAVEVALFDLAAQAAGVPLSEFLGGGVSQLETGITISVAEPEAMAASALAAVQRGFTSLKLKVGDTPDKDIQRVQRVAAAIGGQAKIYLDANQAWTSAQAIAVINGLSASGIAVDLLEQPVPAADLTGLALVRAAVNVPVMADESVFSSRDALALIHAEAADILNIKLVKSGGISGALAIVDTAAEAGINCMMGCMLESSIGVSAAAHVAAARSAVINRVDLDAPMLCRENPISGGTLFAGARVELNQTPGLGITSVQGLEFL
ncbi:MAG: dipeptide epimerase [Halioglobus sp.]